MGDIGPAVPIHIEEPEPEKAPVREPAAPERVPEPA